jgi:hypothetical protein
VSATDAVRHASASTELDLEQIESTDVSRPKVAEVVRLVRSELRSHGLPDHLQKVRMLLLTLKNATEHAREVDYERAYRLDEDELMLVHPMLEVIMPDDVEIPALGSAHEALQRLYLQDDEFALVHTREGRNHCVIAVRTDRV